MCGIFGYSSTSFESEHATKMVESLSHRGPDSNGFIVHGNTLLGVTRLAIKDVENGAQPWEFDNLSCVFNGEIYNHKSVRDNLRSQGYIFSTDCDTEVLVKGFHHYGPKILDQLNGIYAFSIFNTDSEELFLARDPVGVKPLVFYEDPNKLVFGSEIKAILKHPDVPRVVDKETLADYFVIGYPLGERTLLKGIKQVKPGQVVGYSDGILSIHHQHNRDEKVEHSDYNQAVSSLANLIESVMLEQMPADWQPTIFLSGGIDSSLLSLVASRINPRARNISINQNGLEDTFFSVLFSEKHALPIELLNVSPGEFISDLPLFVYHSENLGYDAFGIWKLCQFARTVSPVALCGQGADELFGGYNKHTNPLGFASKLRTNVDALNKISGGFEDEEIFIQLIERISEGEDPSSVVINWDSEHELRNIQLWDYDRVSMAHGLELRVPYLDRSIFSFARNIPSSYLLRGTTNKAVLRDAAAAIGLCEEITQRPKFPGGRMITQMAVDEVESFFDSAISDEMIRGDPHSFYFFEAPFSVDSPNTKFGMFLLFKHIFIDNAGELHGKSIDEIIRGGERKDETK